MQANTLISVEFTGELQRVFDSSNGKMMYLVGVEPIVMEPEQWRELEKESKLSLKIVPPSSS